MLISETDFLPQSSRAEVLRFIVGDGHAELRAKRHNAKGLAGREFIHVRANDFEERLKVFCAKHVQDEIYFGVVRRNDGQKRRGNGGKSNCGAVACLWADIDFKHSSEDEARKRLAAFPLSPSIVVNSGAGLHCYWLLKEPVSSHFKAEFMLKKIAAELGADPAVCDIAHVLRVPDTFNNKYGEPRRVVVETPAI